MIIKNTHTNTFIFNGLNDIKIIIRPGDNEISDKELALLQKNKAFINDCSSGVFTEHRPLVAITNKVLGNKNNKNKNKKDQEDNEVIDHEVDNFIDT